MCTMSATIDKETAHGILKFSTHVNIFSNNQ